MRQFEPPESAQRLTTSFGYYGSTQNRTVSNCRLGAFLWDPTDAKFDRPVTLPPGRARLANQTRPTGSATLAITMGIDEGGLMSYGAASMTSFGARPTI